MMNRNTQYCKDKRLKCDYNQNPNKLSIVYVAVGF